MTIVRTYVPNPPASPYEQGPASAACTNLPADEGVWAAARRSYVEGCSTPVVAERHGLNERTVRRRAAAEDWRSLRVAARPSAPLFAGEPATAEDELERDPDLEPFVAAHTYEVGELLMQATPERLARFAFRRSAEAAARGAAAEALSWMRLVQAIDRAHERLDKAARPFNAADYLRASYAGRLRRVFEDEMDGEGAAGADGLTGDGGAPA